MSELIDLSELNFDLLQRLYGQLKLLDENGQLKMYGTLGKSYEHLETIKLETLAYDDETKELLSFYNSDVTILVRQLSEKLNLELNLKSLLEKILDAVFTHNTADINLGRLLREFDLKLEEVESVKDFLMNSSNATVKNLFHKFFFVPIELELILAVLFANIDEDVLRRQFQEFDDIAPYAEVTEENIEELFKEFDKAKELMDDALKEEHLNIEMKLLDQMLNKCADVELSTCEIENDMKKMQDDLNELIKCDVASMKQMCLRERCVIDDDTTPENYLSPKRIRRCGPTNQTSEKQEFVDTQGEIEDITQIRLPSLLSRNMPATLPQLRVNDHCLILETNQKYWREAVVLKISPNDVIVRLGNYKNLGNIPEGKTVAVHKSHVAFFTYPTWVLPIGDRVVAVFSGFDDQCNDWLGGIVGEQPSQARNNNRYLIFFDNGEAQYVDYRNIRRVYGPSSPGYLDINDKPEVALFIMEYLKRYPERAVVRLKKDQIVKVEYNNFWTKTRVVDVDGMMVQVLFDDGHVEWLYRGNKRLEPIHSQEANVQANIQSGRRYRRSNRVSAPVVEFLSDDEGQDDEDSNGGGRANASSLQNQPLQYSGNVQVARKSTTRGRSTVTRQSVSYQEEEGFEFSEKILDGGIDVPKFYSRHVCSQMCLTSDDDPQLFKGKNPYSVPMRCGWERILSQTTGVSDNTRKRTVVTYLAPCGKRLRSMNEIAIYLRKTESQLTIDLFCFDFAVRPFVRYRVRNPLHFDADFTKGRENVPIECVNCLSYEAPQKLNYEPKRYTTDQTVNLHLALEFLSGCDCDDNCADKSRCSCHQSTISQASGPYFDRSVRCGYENRFLNKWVFTGIFECNARCRCNSRCTNRVVQNPLTTVLQLFKTHNRGWGVRTLYDIPKGAFIAIYAGNVLSDKVANELGQIQGDEYFAELDLIQNAEQLKLGYEENVVNDDESRSEDADEENSDSMDESSTRVNRVRRRNTDDDDVICLEEAETFNPVVNAYSLNKSSADRRELKGSGQPVSTIKKQWSIAEYIGEDKVYTLDAKVSGNIGRYLNHSCSPNVYVQNVYVDTHDLSLPWVAFFANNRIKAGSELCWDYAYVVGSVPNKNIKCYCKSANCRRRLL